MTDIQGLLQLMLQSQANRQGAIIDALQNRPSKIGVSRADSEKHANRGLARWYKMNPGAAPAMPENPFGRGKYADGLLQGVVDAQNNYRNIMSGAPRLQTAKGDLINSNYPGQPPQRSSATSKPLTIPNLSGAADVQPAGNGLLDLTQFNPTGAASAPAQNVLAPSNTDAGLAQHFVSPLPQQNVALPNVPQISESSFIPTGQPFRPELVSSPDPVNKPFQGLLPEAFFMAAQPAADTATLFNALLFSNAFGGTDILKARLNDPRGTLLRNQ